MNESRTPYTNESRTLTYNESTHCTYPTTHRLGPLFVKHFIYERVTNSIYEWVTNFNPYPTDWVLCLWSTSCMNQSWIFEGTPYMNESQTPYTNESRTLTPIPQIGSFACEALHTCTSHESMRALYICFIRALLQDIYLWGHPIECLHRVPA